MHTTIAYFESAGAIATYTNEKLAALADQHVKISGDKIYIPEMNQIIGALACLGVATPTEVRLVSPSLRRINPYYIVPFEPGAAPVDCLSFPYRPANPVPLDITEALEVEITTSGDVAVGEDTYVVVFLADGGISPVTGNIITINANYDDVTTEDEWIYSELTFPDSLPVGKYNIVGARMVMAGGVAFRFVPIGASHRPGGVIAQALGDPDTPKQRFGGLGNWLQFDTQQPPGIEVLANSVAGSETELYIDLIKV